MLLLWHDAAEQNDVDPTDSASLLLLGSGPVPPSLGGRPTHGMGSHVAAVYQAHGWMRAESAVTPGAGQDSQAEAGVAVAMVLLRLKAFGTDMLITYNLPAPRPDVPHTTCEPAEHLLLQTPKQEDDRVSPIVPCAPLSHHDILSTYYATQDASKTAEQIASILGKRSDGGPFWWPKLCEAVQKKYGGKLVTLELALDDVSSTPDVSHKLVWREALEILRLFVAGCKLHDTGLFDVGSGGGN